MYAEESPKPSQRNYIEPRVRAYFADIPILAEIAWCESRYRHLHSSGSVLRGEINSRDVGVMQVNEYYHLETALDRGFDIYDFEGNMAYARDLYKRKGSQPWISSKPCWGKRLK